MKIAILTNNDVIWSLPMWEKTVGQLRSQGHELCAIFVVPETLGSQRGIQIPMRYLRLFGFWETLIMGGYGIRVRLGRLFGGGMSWRGLCKSSGADFIERRSANDELIARWVAEHNIDILFISVNEVLKGPILEAPRIGLINKHAALLPNGRGVFPFLWALIHEQPIGVTLHQVNEGIDSGTILCQWPHPKNAQQISMLKFYQDVFFLFPEMALTAIRRLKDGLPAADPGLEGSYYGFPKPHDVKQFRSKGGRFARITDLFYKPRYHYMEPTP